MNSIALIVKEKKNKIMNKKHTYIYDYSRMIIKYAGDKTRKIREYTRKGARKTAESFKNNACTLFHRNVISVMPWENIWEKNLSTHSHTKNNPLNID